MDAKKKLMIRDKLIDSAVLNHSKNNKFWIFALVTWRWVDIFNRVHEGCVWGVFGCSGNFSLFEE